MAAKSIRATELEQAILEAIQIMDDADGSRTAMITAYDNSRATLTEAYGDEFERDYAIFNNEEFIDEDEDFEEED